MELII